MVVLFRRTSHDQAQGLMISSFTPLGLERSNILLDERPTSASCITPDGGVILARVPFGVASTNRTCLFFYGKAKTPHFVTALGVMEGSIKAVCDTGSMVMCLARVNSSKDGRLALLSMSRDGKRHRQWFPGIDGLVGMEPIESGAGVLLIDSDGGRWGV